MILFLILFFPFRFYYFTLTIFSLEIFSLRIFSLIKQAKIFLVIAEFSVCQCLLTIEDVVFFEEENWRRK
ncbi:hypothetical protein REPUB_Repub13aG0075100 [Reevesia pubescens]